MSNDSTSNLTDLLSSTPYSLAYSLPLLCLSFILTFAGTFLMLDRSRSFPPRTDYSALPGAFEKPRKHNFIWVLEGGIGGLASGYTIGLHLATFLSLLIPATTSSAPLSPRSFLAVWVLTCALSTTLASRYRYAALAVSGISGGALTSLALCVIIHPSLTPRIVLMAILVPLLMILVLLFYFIPKFHSWLLHPTLRFCTSSVGAFGIVLSISLLLNPRVNAWANVWERLWLRDGEDWGTGREKGLSAAYGIFLAVGMASDWALRRWLGECPDEKWDNYLANYTANLPNQADRAGIFEPPKPFWDRFTSPFDDKKSPIIFPSDSDLKAHPRPARKSVEFNGPSLPSAAGAYLKKSRTQSRGYRQQNPSRKRKPVKFGAIDELSSSDEETSPVLAVPPLSYSSSTPTLVDEPPKALRKKHTNDDPLARSLEIDYDVELAELKKLKGSHIDTTPDYSDNEEDLTSISQRRPSLEHGPWSPAFMKRHSPGSSNAAGSDPGAAPHVPVGVGAASVPATPSLIKALDRIAIAQKHAFGQGTAPMRAPKGVEEIVKEEEESHASTVEHERRERTPRWEEFWREVRVKAQS